MRNLISFFIDLFNILKKIIPFEINIQAILSIKINNKQ